MDFQKVKKGLNDPRGAMFYFQDKIDRQSGRFFFKNTSGLSNNLKGYFTTKSMKKNKKKFKTTDNLLVKQFREKGYVKLGSLYDPELISRIDQKFKKFIDDDKYSWIRGKYGDKIYSRSLYEGHQLIPESIELLNDKIVEIVENYYQSYFNVIKLAFYRNYHAPSNIIEKTEIFSNRWHCDAMNTTWVKLFIYLTDVSERDGPFQVQSGERTKELMNLGYHSRQNYKISLDTLEDERYVWKATGKIGTALMCNCNLGLHRAGVPEPGRYRDIIQFMFAPSSVPLPKDWYKHFFDPQEPIRQNIRE